MYIPPFRRPGTVALEQGSTSASTRTRAQLSLPLPIDVLWDSAALIVFRNTVAKSTGARFMYFTAIVNAKRSHVCLDIVLPQLVNRNARFFLAKDIFGSASPQQRRFGNRFHRPHEVSRLNGGACLARRSA